MRMLMLTDSDAPVAEVVEFSDGSVSVRWLNYEANARFASREALRDALLAPHPGWRLVPVATEPLAEQVRARREREGLSQRALAKQLGMSFSTVSRIEAGKNFVLSPALEAWLNTGG